MKNKTAMRQLIERLQNMYNDASFPSLPKEGILIAINTAMNELNSLETERQQTIDLFVNCMRDGTNREGNTAFTDEDEKLVRTDMANFFDETYGENYKLTVALF